MIPHIARLRALAVVVSAGVLVPSLAHGYVRYKTECGAPFYWPDKSHLITGYPNDMAGMMTSDQINTAAGGAAAAWSQDAGDNACTYNVINLALSTDATPVAEYDHKNSLIFRRTSWCAPTDVPPKCSYDPQALALTSLFVSRGGSTAGQIKDADVEVNALNFTWTDIVMNPSATTSQDLQNALTHEFGHFIGLDHTCWIAGSLPTDDAGAPIVPLDYMGNPVPECSNTLPLSIRETTMYPSAPPDDTSKRTIEADDRLGLCQIYPVSTGQPSAGSCPDSTSCNCAVVPSGPGAVVGAGLLLLGAVVFARRRRRRQQRRQRS
jgi:MYXO-CTERM domain-containing protein